MTTDTWISKHQMLVCQIRINWKGLYQIRTLNKEKKVPKNLREFDNKLDKNSANGLRRYIMR